MVNQSRETTILFIQESEFSFIHHQFLVQCHYHMHSVRVTVRMPFINPSKYSILVNLVELNPRANWPLQCNRRSSGPQRGYACLKDNIVIQVSTHLPIAFLISFSITQLSHVRSRVHVWTIAAAAATDGRKRHSYSTTASALIG